MGVRVERAAKLQSKLALVVIGRPAALTKLSLCTCHIWLPTLRLGKRPAGDS